jgi:FG-GAP-like repeat
VDLDGDGQRDILSGSYSRMEKSMAGLFQVLRGQSEGAFKKADVLNAENGDPLIIPVKEENWIENICTRPFAIDWNGDGNLDLVVGNFAGTFFLFKGQGKGKFLPEPEQIKVADKPLKIEGNHSDPFVIDWDGDGDLDLLSGSSQGGVQWAENRAGLGKSPKFQSFRSLIEPGPQPEDGQILRDEDLKRPSSCTRIWVDDINSDGKLDLLVGDAVTLVSPASGLSETEFKKKHAAWRDSVTKATKELNGTLEDANAMKEAQQRLRTLYSERDGFMHEDNTGFVWLYLQK